MMRGTVWALVWRWKTGAMENTLDGFGINIRLPARIETGKFDFLHDVYDTQAEAAQMLILAIEAYPSYDFKIVELEQISPNHHPGYSRLVLSQLDYK